LARSIAGSTVAERYAGTLFDLARTGNVIGNVEASLETFQNILRESDDLRRLVLNPTFTVAEQEKGLVAVLNAAGIEGLTRDFLLVLAKNRRLFAVESVIAAFRSLAAKERGEVEAEVVSAVPLSEAQTQNLVDTLRQKLGKTPKLTAIVDPKLLGGLVVRIGSQMIDTSLRTKLKNLEKVMKEAS
jgi:F-type H+-transporting ATPase subunit delta